MRLWPFGRAERKSATVRTETLDQIAAALGFGGRGAPVMSDQAALQVSAVLCAVRVIAEGLAQMPLGVRRSEKVRNRVVNRLAPDHFASKLFSRRPNGWQSPFEFIEHAGICAALTGNFVAWKVTNGAGEVTELLPILPGAWSLRRERDWGLVYQITFDPGDSRTVPGSQVLHVRGPSWDAAQGFRPVHMAAEALGLAVAVERQQGTLARAGGRPSGLLMLKEPLSDDRKKALRQAWMDRFGAGGEGGVAVLDMDADFKAMSQTLVDAQAIETRTFQIQEVARIFRVYPQMLMQTDKASTFGSAESFFRAHVIHTLGPWMQRFEQAINRDVIGGDGSVFADFDERQMLRGDFKDQADFYARALGAGGQPAWMTQNDVRADLGLDPVDDASADQLPARLGDGPRESGDA